MFSGTNESTKEWLLVNKGYKTILVIEIFPLWIQKSMSSFVKILFKDFRLNDQFTKHAKCKIVYPGLPRGFSLTRSILRVVVTCSRYEGRGKHGDTNLIKWRCDGSSKWCYQRHVIHYYALLKIFFRMKGFMTTNLVVVGTGVCKIYILRSPGGISIPLYLCKGFLVY